jgi:pimeloyl-ACP methyl ester carboxylesterase
MYLFLHGALGAATQFDTFFSQYPEIKSTAISLNFPGHGGLPATESFSLSYLGANIIQYLDDNDIAQTHLFGYSMGGYIALYLAWQYPERIHSVITLNTKLDWTPEVAAKMQSMMDPAKISVKAPQVAAQMAAVHAPGDWTELAAETARFLEVLASGGGLPDAAFSLISAPVVMLRGEKDHVVTAQECERIAALIPHARYAEVPESGHQWEQVQFSAIAGFFSKS